MELHFFGVTDKRKLWHSIGHGAGKWDPLGDVNRQVGPVGADIVDAACTTDTAKAISMRSFSLTTVGSGTPSGRLWNSRISRDTRDTKPETGSASKTCVNHRNRPPISRRSTPWAPPPKA